MRLLLFLLLGLVPALAAAESWRFDPATRVAVDVTWRGAVIELRFPEYSGAIAFDEDTPESAKAHIVVASGAVETGVPPVDAVVKGPDFLGAEAWPEIVFDLDDLVVTSESTAEIGGRLTLRGETRPVSLQATVTQYGPDPQDPARFVAGFDISGVVDRTAFGATGGLPDVEPEIALRIHLAISR